MTIREMSRSECLQALAGPRLARLACARQNQPYVVPVYLAYDEASDSLCGFTTPGQKVDWMRINPLVCVETDDVTAFDQWISVIATGRYEELPETFEDVEPGRAPERHGGSTPAEGPHHDSERERAFRILAAHPMWQEPGCAAWMSRVPPDTTEPFSPIFYRIRIDHITGHEATR